MPTECSACACGAKMGFPHRARGLIQSAEVMQLSAARLPEMGWCFVMVTCPSFS